MIDALVAIFVIGGFYVFMLAGIVYLTFDAFFTVPRGHKRVVRNVFADRKRVVESPGRHWKLPGWEEIER